MSIKVRLGQAYFRCTMVSPSHSLVCNNASAYTYVCRLQEDSGKRLVVHNCYTHARTHAQRLRGTVPFVPLSLSLSRLCQRAGESNESCDSVNISSKQQSWRNKDELPGYMHRRRRKNEAKETMSMSTMPKKEQFPLLTYNLLLLASFFA